MFATSAVWPVPTRHGQHDAIAGRRDHARWTFDCNAADKAGAPVAALHATNVPNRNALMAVGVDLTGKVGFAVTDATSDGERCCSAGRTRAPSIMADGAP